MVPALLLLLTAAVAQPAVPAPRHGPSPDTNRVRPPGLLSPAERAAAPLSPDWLVGDWQWAGYMSNGGRVRACDPEPETAFFPDGTYRMGNGFGHWTLVGGRLTTRLDREPSIWPFQVRLGDPDVSRIRKLGPDDIGVRWPGVPESRFMRCG